MLFGTGLESMLAPKRGTEASGIRRGRHPISREILLSVADAYAQAVAAGNSKPIHAVGATLGLTKVRARDLVHRCRLRGFLTNTPAGRAGGALTPDAATLLSVQRRQMNKSHEKQWGARGHAGRRPGSKDDPHKRPPKPKSTRRHR
jgi:hypothetical protein